MAVLLRNYTLEKDYHKVIKFFSETYSSNGKFPNWLQPRWEYMHYHPILDRSNLDKIGIWEDNGNIVAVANYEMSLGDAFLHVYPNYGYLKKEMFDYAEENLTNYSIKHPDKKYLSVYINDFDEDLEQIAQSKGYQKTEVNQPYSDITWQTISNQFLQVQLPEGFRVQSLSINNDLSKIDKCLWKGFNHEGEAPDDGVKDRKMMQSAPNFNKDLNIVVVAPDGDFVAYAGLWYVKEHNYAYVEPVATVPEYRRMGLGKAALLEAIRRCSQLGAEIVYVESSLPIYLSCGFKKTFSRYPWIKYF